MNLIALRGEKKVGEIVERVYGDLKPADAKRAEEALIRANPQLKKPGNVKPGDLIIVPQVPGLAAKAAGGDENPPAARIAAIRIALKSYHQQLVKAHAAELAEQREAADLLKSREVKELPKRVPDAAKLLDRVAEAMKERAEEAKRRAVFLKAVERAEVDLEALERKLA
jgi:hypothetical protein